MALGVISLLVALAPTLTLELVAIPLLGLASISFMVNGNASLQLASAADMRGRVMALYAVVFLGSTPIGAPLAGWLAEHLGPRPAIGIGGGAALIASAIALWMLLRSRAGGRETVPAASRERGSAEDREPAPAPGPGDQVLRVS
jgi:MFS family permease